MTGVNKQTIELYTEEAKMLGKLFKQANKGFAVVLASNDGTEIRLIKEIAGFKKVIGVDPATNLAKIANSKGLTTINDFFTYKLSKDIIKKWGQADLIVANNVYAHIPDPADMLEGMKNLLKPTGLIEIEVHWLRNLVKELQIDILYSEHYYEWTLKAMQINAHIHGMKVVRAEYLPRQQGGSIRFWLAKSGYEAHALNRIEAINGLYSIKTMKDLQKRADERKRRLVRLIKKLKREGKIVGVWSVPAKIVTILNFCNLTNNEISFAYEVAPTKIGRYIPKANILIKDEKEILKDMPDYLLIGAWNYMGVARKVLAPYVAKGGKLINPLVV